MEALSVNEDEPYEPDVKADVAGLEPGAENKPRTGKIPVNARGRRRIQVHVESTDSSGDQAGSVVDALEGRSARLDMEQLGNKIEPNELDEV